LDDKLAYSNFRYEKTSAKIYNPINFYSAPEPKISLPPLSCCKLDYSNGDALPRAKPQDGAALLDAEKYKTHGAESFVRSSNNSDDFLFEVRTTLGT
jgi:hypothetical protein